MGFNAGKLPGGTGMCLHSCESLRLIRLPAAPVLVAPPVGMESKVFLKSKHVDLLLPGPKPVSFLSRCLIYFPLKFFSFKKHESFSSIYQKGFAPVFCFCGYLQQLPTVSGMLLLLW